MSINGSSTFTTTTNSPTTSSSSSSSSSTSSSFINKRKLGLTVNIVEKEKAREKEEVVDTNIYVVNGSPNMYLGNNNNNNNNTTLSLSPTSSSPSSSCSSYSPTSLSPVLLPKHHNNVNSSPFNSTSSATSLSTSVASKLGYQLRINTNALNGSTTHYSGTSPSSSSSSSDEPLESSRWLGCDIDKFKTYDSICSQVTDYLYMGSETIASDLATLQRHGITHIINASIQCVNYFEDHPDHPFIYRKFPLHDHPTEDISAVFSQVIEFIEQARRQQGRVFVHCQMGVSRSTCLCILWMMHSERWSLEQASDAVRQIRPISRPNAGFQLCLLNWAIKQGIQTTPYQSLSVDHSSSSSSSSTTTSNSNINNINNNNTNTTNNNNNNDFSNLSIIQQPCNLDSSSSHLDYYKKK